MIEWLLIGIFIGFSLPFLIRWRSDIFEFMKLRKENPKSRDD